MDVWFAEHCAALTTVDLPWGSAGLGTVAWDVVLNYISAVVYWTVHSPLFKKLLVFFLPVYCVIPYIFQKWGGVSKADLFVRLNMWFWANEAQDYSQFVVEKKEKVYQIVSVV
jgi:hypothetical protein